jgi:hypothetical protein
LLSKLTIQTNIATCPYFYPPAPFGEWGVKIMKLRSYFNDSGFHSNSDLAELLINNIIANRENAMLKS